MNDKVKRFVNWKTLSALILLALCIVMLCMGCKKKGEWYQMEGMAFGTTYHISYQYKMSKDSLVKAQLGKIDMALSLFNDSSTLARLNKGEIVKVDSLFIAVYEKGMAVSEATEGCFDMTVAPLVNLWGFGIDPRNPVNFDSIKSVADSLLQVVGYQKSSLVIEGDSMRLNGCAVDAAAIAKGFACDMVANALKECGCENYCVEIGGEIVVGGLNPHGKEWRIGINKPVEDSGLEVDDVLNLTDCGMATSGNYRNFYKMGTLKVSHTIDPRKGVPVVSSLKSATIVADDCMTADAWATACMVAGLEESVKWMKEHKELKAYLITKEKNGFKMTIVEDGVVKEKEMSH